jgi:hypothetical protein
MKLHTRACRTLEHAGTAFVLVAACLLPLEAQTQHAVPPPLPKPAATVATPALERLLPALAGWAKGRLKSNRVDLTHIQVR